MIRKEILRIAREQFFKSGKEKELNETEGNIAYTTTVIYKRIEIQVKLIKEGNRIYIEYPVYDRDYNETLYKVNC